MSGQYFDSINWASGDELFNQLVSHIGTTEKRPVEIERKWKVDSSVLRWFVQRAKPGYWYTRHVQCVYVPGECEARVRAYYNEYHELEGYKVNCKSEASEDGLCRTELESWTRSEVWEQAMRLATDSSVGHKGSVILPLQFWIFDIDGITYELKSIDMGSEFQLEVEFKSVEDAKNFELPDGLGNIVDEVTNNPSHKLFNYWMETRWIKD